MTQKPLINSDTGLNPALAAALASLEVQLEQELTRYRRTRIGMRANSQSRVNSYSNNYPQELADQNATMANTQLSTVEIKPQTKSLPLPATSQEKSAPVIIKSSTNNKSLQPGSENLSYTPTPVVKTEIQDKSQPQTTPESNTQIPLPPANSTDSSSIIPAIAQGNQSEKLLADDTPAQPDDYLESSEALLRSLTDEQPESSQTNNSSDSLLSPLGIGSMLLLLVASLTLGYVVFNPKSLPQLNLSRLFNGNSSSSAENPQEVGDNSQTQLQPELTPIPKYPNLAAKEFPEVRSPIDVVGLQPKVQPTPIAPANPIAIPAPVIPPAINPLPEAQPLPTLDASIAPSLQPLPQVTATPPLAMSDAPPPVIAEIKPSADGRYHIVIDNQNSNALTAARKVVPDAYLSPNSTLIYLATVKTKEEAQQKLKQLQAKGVKARLQQP
ncbi:hypothetical protein [Anabaena subtropica]|uniref:SPOR domain-containing protein n=1 Tax=Anabaena subtropica FACHB-260 TaxID=2692884 RepID=A0ABR8CV64_9NOST|nr:hypothetical protein [Anabaena subtropica]MBD2345675.1 hypothetical protein [Anabaena subtropica FACHB-260]